MFVSKYCASGNDFILFHTFRKGDFTALAKRVCNRHYGLGADGLIVLFPHDEVDFEWDFYNADGSHAAMCGNGSRAAALYAHQNGLCAPKLLFMTQAGLIAASVEEEGIVESELTPPNILKESFEEEGLTWWQIDTGVPHLVTFVEDLSLFDKTTARIMRNRYNSNVNFAKVVDARNLMVRTYERGVEDETLACGTGMAASYYRALLEKRIEQHIVVKPTSGEQLYLGMNERTITFKGKVERVFDTTITM